MSPPNPKRNTQFDLAGLRVKELPTITESHVRERQQNSQDPVIPKARVQKRRRSRSPQGQWAAKRAGAGLYDYGVKDESPWESYRKIYQLKFDQFVTVAVQNGSSNKRVVVKRLSGAESEDEIKRINKIEHDKIVTVLETFHFDNAFYVVLERMSISLTQIVASPPYPSERELAAIAGQILEGLAYLASRGLVHGSLSCSNILLSDKGDVKIAAQECCRQVASSDNSGVEDVRALGGIMMELMQKHAKENGRVGIENLDRWPSDSAAVEFVSATSFGPPAKELMKHRLLQCNWRKDWLEGIIDWANVSAFRLHKPAG